jgi:predicted DNA-binding protein
MMKKNVNILFPADVVIRIKRMAKKKGKTISAYIREIVIESIKSPSQRRHNNTRKED